MARLFPILYFALLVLMVPVESAGQYTGNLAKLNEVKIYVIDFGQDAKEFGLTVDNIKNHAFVLLRSKLPRLAVKESATTTVTIRVTISYVLQGEEKIGRFGAIETMVYRPVTFEKTGKKTFAIAWEVINTAIGSLSTTDVHVREILDKQLTKFAADWYRDNP